MTNVIRDEFLEKVSQIFSDLFLAILFIFVCFLSFFILFFVRDVDDSGFVL